MNSPTTYVPSLKWRLAEYQALCRLHEPVKDRITPLINVPPLEWYFEEKKLKKTEIKEGFTKNITVDNQVKEG